MEETMPGILKLMAGKRALEIIRDEGLRQERIRVMAGAAGGPKWLVLGGLDRVLFGNFFRKRKDPLFLLGSSIGSWRFAALCCKNGITALDAFENAYLDQFYTAVPSTDEVSMVSWRILDDYLEDGNTPEVLNHPYLRLSMLAVKSKNIFNAASRGGLAAGMVAASLCNIVTRKAMGCFFERALFYDARDIPPFIDLGGFPLQKVRLTKDNLKPAIMASGSIPLVMNGVKDIPGAAGGVYRDGGMLDYQLDIPMDPDPERIVLFPHYTDTIIPGWLDKHLPWRRAPEEHLNNVLIVCPSREFVAGLPFGKIPDRNDFMRFRGRDRERLDYWHAAIEGGRALGEEFYEAVTSGKIRDLVTEYKSS
jgi:hypothetical protein